MARRIAEKAAKKKADLVAKQNQHLLNDNPIPPEEIIDTTAGRDDISSDRMGNAEGYSHKRQSTGEIAHTYRPAWSILETDKFGARASIEAKKVGADFFRALILPGVRATYDAVGVVSTCSELLGHLTMAGPWATAIEVKVEDMDTQLKNVKEEDMDTQLKNVKEESKELKQRVTSLEIDRNAAYDERDRFKSRSERRTAMFRKARMAEKKATKLVTRSEDRGFTAGFEEAVKRAHATGLDYKLILGDEFEDPIARSPEPDLPEVVSSDPESVLSD